MKIIAQSGMKYIPKWHKNHKEPEETQIVIMWNYLAGVDREIVYGFEPIAFSIDKKGEVGEMPNKYTFRSDNIELIKRSIVHIQNLEIVENGEHRPAIADDICNLSELAGLYRELMTFFTTENAEGEKKN